MFKIFMFNITKVFLSSLEQSFKTMRIAAILWCVQGLMVVALENNLLLRWAPKAIISQNVHLLKKCHAVREQLEAKACYHSFPAQLLSGWFIAGVCSHPACHKDHMEQFECLGEECSFLAFATKCSDNIFWLCLCQLVPSCELKVGSNLSAPADACVSQKCGVGGEVSGKEWICLSYISGMKYLVPSSLAVSWSNQVWVWRYSQISGMFNVILT